MDLFNLSSAQKMLLFSEINNPQNDSFYLKFRKDYDLGDYEYVKSAIELISRKYLNLQIKYDENADFKQYFVDADEVNVDSFDFSGSDLDGIDGDIGGSGVGSFDGDIGGSDVDSFDGDLDEFIKNYLDKPFDDIFDSPLYKWAVLKTDSSCVLIGVVQHILLDGTSLYSIVPREIEKCIAAFKNNEDYIPIDYSYKKP